ncbi:hypothetical protein LCGC14_0527420 [marine sediment metagenome]|uniref:Uncharacterized protein n=1 Tax=marine sediment metagenome TaxID=412755 RepID=A0A0F9UI15_9ZZZZ
MPDELETKQDESSVESKETSQETETFTKKLEEAERKGKSDGLVEVGRLRTENAKLVSNSQKITARLDRIQKESDEAEIKAAEGNTEQLSAITERQTRRTAESNLESMTQERDEANEKLQGYTKIEASLKGEEIANEVAERLGVDKRSLIKLAKRTDWSLEAIEEIANELPKKGGTVELDKVDSGRTIGGKGREKIVEDYIKNPDDPKIKQRYTELRASEGR